MKDDDQEPVELDNAAKVALVIEKIEAGSSERSACEEVGISRSTFRTTALRQGAGDHYARALHGLALDQVEKLEQTIQDMRDGSLDPAIGRIEVDARKWFASKFLPKQFGDKIAHVGGDPESGDRPVQVAFDMLMEAVSANGRPRPGS